MPIWKKYNLIKSINNSLQFKFNCELDLHLEIWTFFNIVNIKFQNKKCNNIICQIKY